jgi:hypothetical protein
MLRAVQRERDADREGDRGEDQGSGAEIAMILLLLFIS